MMASRPLFDLPSQKGREITDSGLSNGRRACGPETDAAQPAPFPDVRTCAVGSAAPAPSQCCRRVDTARYCSHPGARPGRAQRGSAAHQLARVPSELLPGPALPSLPVQWPGRPRDSAAGKPQALRIEGEAAPPSPRGASARPAPPSGSRARARGGSQATRLEASAADNGRSVTVSRGAENSRVYPKCRSVERSRKQSSVPEEPQCRVEPKTAVLSRSPECVRGLTNPPGSAQPSSAEPSPVQPNPAQFS